MRKVGVLFIARTFVLLIEDNGGVRELHAAQALEDEVLRFVDEMLVWRKAEFRAELNRA